MVKALSANTHRSLIFSQKRLIKKKKQNSADLACTEFLLVLQQDTMTKVIWEFDVINLMYQLETFMGSATGRHNFLYAC